MRAEKPFDLIRTAIRDSMRRSGAGARTLEAKLGLKPWSLRGILDRRRPQVPSVDRAFEICQALGLEFYIGPPGGPRSSRPPTQSDPTPDWVEILRSEIRRALKPENSGLFDDQVGVPHLKTLVGSGADRLDPEEIGLVPFRRSWLLQNGIDPRRCYMVQIQGEAMAPTLPDQCLVLVNPSRRDRQDDGIYLVRSSRGLIARRARIGPNGTRLMVADNPAVNDPVLPTDEDVLGELVWMARCLRGKTSEVGVQLWETQWQTGRSELGRSG